MAQNGDKVREILSYLIVGVALLYVLIIALGYITGWRTEVESTVHLAAVGAFFSGIFGVILGYYFGRHGLTTAQKQLQEALPFQHVAGEMERCLTQLQGVAKQYLNQAGKTAAQRKELDDIQSYIHYTDAALKQLKHTRGLEASK